MLHIPLVSLAQTLQMLLAGIIVTKSVLNMVSAVATGYQLDETLQSYAIQMNFAPSLVLHSQILPLI